MGPAGVRPLIGVTTSEVRAVHHVEPAAQGEPPRREMALGLPYLRAIESAGGLPVVLPPLQLEAVDPLLERLSGVCLSGGPDLDPVAYRARPHPQLGPTELELDLFELAVARRADALGLPILAICRGAQALNVARGGTLRQHLPEDASSEIEHRQRVASDQTTHLVRVSPDSRLHGLLGVTTLEVNSFHHQAVDRLGRGLTAAAWAPDGVIEAIEASRLALCIGVQWHVEALVDRVEHAALFSALVEAARDHSVSREGVQAA